MATYTNNDEIQSLLEDLMSKEEARGVQLKKKYDELSIQMSKDHLVEKDVTIGSEVVLMCGTTKNKPTVVRPTGTLDDFTGNVAIGLGNEKPTKGFKVGFRDDSGKTIYLRNNIDLQYLFRWYFGQEPPFVPIVAIPLEEVEIFKKFEFRKEHLPKEIGTTFRVEAAGHDAPLIFISIPQSNSYSEGLKYLKGIFPKMTQLMFVDEVEDVITVDSNESWEYCIETSQAMSKYGRYPLLIIQNE